jgi:hypothetical protein
MRVGELDDSDGTHSNGLYKHAGELRVMHFTAPFHRAGTG